MTRQGLSAGNIAGAAQLGELTTSYRGDGHVRGPAVRGICLGRQPADVDQVIHHPLHLLPCLTE